MLYVFLNGRLLLSSWVLGFFVSDCIRGSGHIIWTFQEEGENSGMT